MSFLVLFVLASAGLGACLHSAAFVRRVEADHPPIGQIVPVNGHDVHVITQGEEGPPVLMLHGAGANAREFLSTLAPHFDETHRLFMADRPGHGYSDRPEEAHALDVQARQMADALRALAPGEKAILVGHSFGGAVALRIALDHPELVGGLVLLAPVTHDWGGGGEAWYNKYAAPPVLGHAFSQIVPLVAPGQSAAAVENVFNPVAAPSHYVDRAGLHLLFRPDTFRANARDVLALQTELGKQSARYSELNVPIIVFSGSGDTVLTPKLHVGRLKKQVPVDLVILPEEGHMPHHGEAKAVVDAIRRLASAQESR